MKDSAPGPDAGSVLAVGRGQDHAVAPSTRKRRRDHHERLRHHAAAPRPGEVEGKDYFFVSAQQFQRWRTATRSWNSVVFGNHYGTPARAGADWRWHGGAMCCSTLTGRAPSNCKPTGRRRPGQHFHPAAQPSRAGAPPSRRAQDSEEVVAGAHGQGHNEISHWAEYDYVVINNDLVRHLAEIRAILDAERMKRGRQTGIAAFVAS